jgi:predicted lactoylglutathione lyase
MKRQEHKISDSYNDYLNKAIQNIYIPVNYTPILPESRHGVVSTLENSFKEVEKLNEQIKQADLADDDMLKSSLRQQKNAICQRMVEYSGDSINKSQVSKDQDEYWVYKRKFIAEQEQDMDLMEKHYGEFKPANYSNNKMLLEIKDYYKDLEARINKTLTDKNVDPESVAKTWQSIRQNYKNHVEKCESHETFVKQMQYKVLDHGCLWGGTDKPKSFIDAKNMAEQLNVRHKQAIDNLKFNSEQVVKQFVAKGLEISGQSPEESSIILEVKSIGENLEETINKSLADKNIDDEVKLQVWQLPFYSSKYKQVLDKFKTHEQLVRIYEDKILNCDTAVKADSLNMELKKMHTDATEELNFHTNQAIKHFVTKALQISGKPLEETSMMSDIKNLPDEFNKKINKNLSDNDINQKIKSDIDDLFRSKCDQHLEKLKLIEKSIEKYEALPNSKKTEKIINHLAQRYKQIDKWEAESDDLIEKITIKALELSYMAQPMLNQQNNLSVQKLSDKVDELTKIIDKMNQNNLGGLPVIEQSHHEGSLDDSKSAISISSSWQMEGFSENNSKKEAIKTEKKRGEIKGDIRMIKMGVIEGWPDNKIKPFIKKITNEDLFQVIKNDILSNPANLDDSGYESGIINESDLMGQID